jgi:hypothetical protein
MGKESRKSLRFECPIPAELVNLEGKDELIDKITAHDFSTEGLKLVISFKFNPGSNMDLKLSIPEKKLSAQLSGEITWTKCADNKLEVGIKIKEMDKDSKSEIISWVFQKWLKKEQNKRKP